MINFVEGNAIADLIFKVVIGQSLTEQERSLLDSWRHKSERHEQLFIKLTDREWLQETYETRTSIDLERPKAEMRARIEAFERDQAVIGKETPSIGSRVRRMLLPLSNIAAVVAIIFGGIYFFKYQESEKNLAQISALMNIRPGRTHATAIVSDGSSISLESNMASEELLSSMPAVPVNQDAIKILKKDVSVEPEKTNEEIKLKTDRGDEFQIRLEDGTLVYLNAETTLIYPSSFGVDERRVYIDGEAYFEVAKDKERPFFVESGGQELKVFGTTFNIKNYPEDSEVQTTLVEGSVMVSRKNIYAGSLMLSPGLQSTFDKLTQAADVKNVDVNVVTSWVNGRFVFENQNLGQIMKTLSRWYNFEYEFNDSKLSQTEFMGSVPRYGDFNQVLEILESSGGLKFRMEGRKIYVSVH